MIYITGDCHGDFRRFNTENFPEQKEMTKDDFVIVCGDFGYWVPSKDREYWMDWLNDKPFTTLFADGNHECFDDLYTIPVEKWNGGKVHKIRDSVIHLMRGQIFKIDGCKIFTFGGARSHDIQGGILESTDPEFHKKRKKLNRGTLPYRINHVSWWEQEMPSKEEMQEGYDNMEAAGWSVDYVVSHCCASSTQALLSGGWYETDELTDYLERIRVRCQFKKWFFGHYHDDRAINDKEILLYEQIIRIW